MNCLAGCISRYYCAPLNRPIDGDNMAPWVRATFVGAGEEITVGNESVPAHGNTACIKSFEYGLSDGFEIHLEILDQEGGVFPKFMDNMLKCISKTNSSFYRARFRWGWTIMNCEGPQAPRMSPIIEGILFHTEVNYSEGKIKYNMTFKHNADVYFDMREDEIFGADGNTIKLELAIRRLCALSPAINVKFCKKNKDGSISCGCLDWKYFGCGGPEAVWAGDSQNRLGTISKWVEPFQTTNNKGIVMTMEPGVPNQLIIWEDPTPDCGEDKACKNNSLGTFIVNGGKCSNVIEFTPKIGWIAGVPKFQAGGESGSAADGGRQQQEDKKKPCSEAAHGKNVGMEQGATISRYAWDVYGPANAYKEVNDAQDRHQKANALYQASGLEPVEAELRILGDPRPQFCTIDSLFRTCAIVAINPFHLTGNNNGGCGDWLAKPGCNEVLSNKGWEVTGIDHAIKEGSYITTLKVRLVVPSIDVGHGDPMGGPGSGGYRPKNTC